MRFLIFVISDGPNTCYGCETMCCASDVDIFHEHNSSKFECSMVLIQSKLQHFLQLYPYNNTSYTWCNYCGCSEYVSYP